MKVVDLVIVGAGIQGLTNAATHLRLHPNASILILDAAPGIGGPWASHRIFPGLKSNNLLGMFEHPDFPMDEETYGVKKGEHIPAETMLKYLSDFVEANDISGCLRLNTHVDFVKKEGAIWHVRCTSANSYSYSLLTTKIIIATGITNKANMPSYATHKSFVPPLIHSKDFPSHFTHIVKPNTHTLVIGAGKSAWDVSYACATQPNSSATILIRPSGNGPNWLVPSHVTPLRLWLEKLVFTRFFGYMSPCPWATMTGIDGWARAFLHGTWLGRKIVAGFWKVLGDDAIALNKLHDHPETRKLVPWRGAFEVANCLGIHNYPSDFFELVRSGKIRVVIDEVESFAEGNEVVFNSGEMLEVDAVVCATGWEVGHSIRFEPEGLEEKMGLPTTRPPSPEEATLIHNASTHLLKQYPILNRDTRPVLHPDPLLRTMHPKTSTQQPFRHYKFMIPPSFLAERSIALSGALHCLGTFPLAYIQSLWIDAYFDGKLALPFPSPEKVLEETYRDTQYCVLRSAAGYGRVAPDIVFDSLPYFDGLLEDLGLEGQRKGGLLGLGEVCRGHGPGDYRGLLDEWLKKQGMRWAKQKDV